MLCKKSVLRNFAKYTRKHLCQSFYKETLAQVFYCKFYEIFKNIFFIEHLWATASDNYSSSKLTSSFFHLCWYLLVQSFDLYLTLFESIFSLLPLLYCSNLFSVSSTKVFAFSWKNLMLNNFFQLEGRCSNCNYFYQPNKTEGFKRQHLAALLSNWCPQSLSFIRCNIDRFSPAWRFA